MSKEKLPQICSFYVWAKGRKTGIAVRLFVQDHEKANGKWHISNGYVVKAGWDSENKKKGLIYLHREIVGAKKGERVYFKDGDKFNCRRDNLVKISPKNTSKIPGISWDKLHQKLKVYKMVGKKRRTVGWFENIGEAAKKLVEKTNE
jgi:hypothetical protein